MKLSSVIDGTVQAVVVLEWCAAATTAGGAPSALMRESRGSKKKNHRLEYMLSSTYDPKIQ